MRPRAWRIDLRRVDDPGGAPMATTWRRRAAMCSSLVLLAVLPVPDSRAAGPVPVEMLNDINTSLVGAGPETASAYPENFASIGGTFYFSAVDEAHGQELWKSDGTAAGTALLKDILSGPDSSDVARLTAVGTTLYFTAKPSPADAAVLWKSDGTAVGTVPVPLQAFPDAPSGPSGLTAGGGLLYFSAAAHNGTNSLGRELWRSDGTAAGTLLLKDIWPGGPGAGGGSGFNGGLVYLNGRVLFPAHSDATDMELWTTDGTPAGTALVLDINPGTVGSMPDQFTAVGTTTYFTADGGGGRALWRTDGTAAGTVLAATPAADSLGQLTAMGGRLYFTANDEPVGSDPDFELWTSDGTTAGTHRVVDLDLGALRFGSSPCDLTVLGGSLYFTADDGFAGRELWKSDGSATGTALIKEVNPNGAAFSTEHSIVTAGGLLFLAADDGTSGSELWQSDGTAAGTQLAMDIRPGAGSGLPYFVSASAALGQLFFSADDGVHGRELWIARATYDTDLDDDGIANDVDTQPTTPSADFTDVGLGGKTSGTVLGLTGGAAVSIVDAPVGVHITVTGPANARARVQISSRPTSEKLPPGVYQLDDPVWDTTLSVLQGGPAEIEAPLNGTVVVITVEEGATVTFTETVSSSGALTGLVVEPDPDNPEGTVQVNGVEVTAGEQLAFGSLNAKLSWSQTAFALSGTFTPGASSDHVQQPLAEDVTLSLGSYPLVIAAGSFSQSATDTFGYSGTVSGVTLAVQLKTTKRGAWELKATGGPVSLTSPVSVGLRIGDDLGFKTLKFR